MMRLLILTSLLFCSFSQGDYRQMATNDFALVAKRFTETKSYRVLYTCKRYEGERLIEEAGGENLKYNNFYYAAFDSTLSLSTNTQSLAVNLREKVMTYTYGYQSSSIDKKMQGLYSNMEASIANAVAVEYEDLGLETGRYTFLLNEGNTWKMSYELNKVKHEIVQVVFYNYYPDYDFQEKVVMDYQLQWQKVKIKDPKYNYGHYIREVSAGREPASAFEGYVLQSVKVKS